MVAQRDSSDAGAKNATSNYAPNDASGRRSHRLLADGLAKLDLGSVRIKEPGELSLLPSYVLEAIASITTRADRHDVDRLGRKERTSRITL
jgi:hypothetical protein